MDLSYVAHLPQLISSSYMIYAQTSVVDPKMIFSDPDPTIQIISDPYLVSDPA